MSILLFSMAWLKCGDKTDRIHLMLNERIICRKVNEMRVAVCDENLDFLDIIKGQLEREQGIKSIDVYSDRNVFQENIKANKIFDLVFLNIEWGKSEENDLEFGENFYEQMKKTPIVLLTENNMEIDPNIWLSELNLTGYLMKPVDDVILGRYVEKIRKKHLVNFVSFSSHGKTIRLLTDDIIHIESHNHKICVFTANDCYVVYEKISDVVKRLPSEFVQCHKSFLINLKWVTHIEGKSIKMVSGKQIPISRTFQGEVKAAVDGYMKEQE